MSDTHIRRYRQALAANFPSLKVENIEYLAEGWDSVAFQVNGELIFRFPKRAEVEKWLEREIRVLPVLAPTLPRPIPHFDYIGRTPTQDYKYLFVGYRAIAGEQLSECEPEVIAADWWKEQLGDFLTALHSFPLAKARQLGVQNADFGGPVETWAAGTTSLYQQVLGQIFPLLGQAQREKIRLFFEHFIAISPTFDYRPVLLHYDLDKEHVLVDITKQQITGIIDFGDIAIGDPAYDVFAFNPPQPYYKGHIDATWQARHDFYVRSHCLNYVLFGLRHNDAALVESGLYEIAALWPD